MRWLFPFQHAYPNISQIQLSRNKYDIVQPPNLAAWKSVHQDWLWCAKVLVPDPCTRQRQPGLVSYYCCWIWVVLGFHCRALSSVRIINHHTQAALNQVWNLRWSKRKNITKHVIINKPKGMASGTEINKLCKKVSVLNKEAAPGWQPIIIPTWCALSHLTVRSFCCWSELHHFPAWCQLQEVAGWQSNATERALPEANLSLLTMGRVTSSQPLWVQFSSSFQLRAELVFLKLKAHDSWTVGEYLCTRKWEIITHILSLFKFTEPPSHPSALLH